MALLVQPEAQALITPREALSGIFGSISLAAWVFVLVPQLYENFASSDASGVSLAFLVVWLFGDITNLIGASWAQLVPTVIALAVYFCFADAILIGQVVYYNYFHNKPRQRTVSQLTAGGAVDDEEQPLLGRRESGASIGLPGSHTRRRRRSSVISDDSVGITRVPTGDHLAQIDEEVQPTRFRRPWVVNTLGIVAICVVGSAGWLIAYKAGLWTPASPPKHVKDTTPLGAEILGYISAVAYLGARIPQIIKNWREQSCEGLSLLFFLLSLAGNFTYGAGVEKQYVLTNLPWLIGSFGTIVEDVAIFVQFRLYEGRSPTASDVVPANGKNNEPARRPDEAAAV